VPGRQVLVLNLGLFEDFGLIFYVFFLAYQTVCLASVVEAH
jgi:hypothetical protein